MRLPDTGKEQFVVEKLAEGMQPSDIKKLALQEDMFDISIREITEIREEYLSAISQLSSMKIKELVRKVPRSNKFIRVQNLNDLAARIESVLYKLLDAGEVNRTLCSMLDSLMKMYRMIAEEADDIEPVVKQTNNYVQIVQQLPPEQRLLLYKQTEELKRLMEATDEVIEGDFSSE